MASKSQPWMTLNQVADHFQVNARTVRRWPSDGHLTAYRIGARMVRFKRSDVEALARRIPTADIDWES